MAEDSGDSRVSYGKELWDCLTLIEKNNENRIKNMKHLKTFFDTFQQTMETFCGSLDQALKKLKSSLIMRNVSQDG